MIFFGQGGCPPAPPASWRAAHRAIQLSPSPAFRWQPHPSHRGYRSCANGAGSGRAAGANVAIASSSNGQVVISSTDTNTEYTAGDGLDLTGTTFSTDLKAGGGLKIASTELAIDDSIVATISGANFAGNVGVTGSIRSTLGYSGSLTNLLDGTSYLAAGANVTITSASNGQVTISSTAPGTPGGSDTQLQFNDGGSFGGISGATTDGSAVTFGDSGILVGQDITHDGDTDTKIVFAEDAIGDYSRW